eukprot:651483-Pelagomonas_calceolata.AAC.3
MAPWLCAHHGMAGAVLPASRPCTTCRAQDACCTLHGEHAHMQVKHGEVAAWLYKAWRPRLLPYPCTSPASLTGFTARGMQVHTRAGYQFVAAWEGSTAPSFRHGSCCPALGTHRHHAKKGCASSFPSFLLRVQSMKDDPEPPHNCTATAGSS